MLRRVKLSLYDWCSLLEFLTFCNILQLTSFIYYDNFMFFNCLYFSLILKLNFLVFVMRSFSSYHQESLSLRLCIWEATTTGKTLVSLVEIMMIIIKSRRFLAQAKREKHVHVRKMNECEYQIMPRRFTLSLVSLKTFYFFHFVLP